LAECGREVREHLMEECREGNWEFLLGNGHRKEEKWIKQDRKAWGRI